MYFSFSDMLVCLLCFFCKDVATGNSILFAPRLAAEYAVWLGEIKPQSYFKVTSSNGFDLRTTRLGDLLCLYFLNF